MKKIISSHRWHAGLRESPGAGGGRQKTGEVLVVYAMEEFCPVALDEVDCNIVRSLMDKEAQNVIAASLKRLQALGVSARAVITRGEPVEAIVAWPTGTGRRNHRLFPRQKGLVKLFKGSVTAKLAEEAPCPVIIVK